MDVSKAINNRRSLRSIEKFDVTEEIIEKLGAAAGLAPSCYNNQPWRFVFVYEENKLKELEDAYSKGNEWCNWGSIAVAVFSKTDFDCVVKDREYYLFDTGMAAGFMMLQAEELGLVTHAIAGFSQKKVKKILNIPDEMKVITMIIVGKKSKEARKKLSEEQIKVEDNRPEREKISEYVYRNQYTE